VLLLARRGAATAARRPGAGGDGLGASVKGRRWKVEGVGQAGDVGERDVALASLDAAVVAAIDPRLEGEPFLGDAALLAQFAQSVAEGGVDGRECGHADSLPSRSL